MISSLTTYRQTFCRAKSNATPNTPVKTVEPDKAKAVRSEDGEYRHFSDGGCLGNICDEDEENVEIEKDVPKVDPVRLDAISNDEGDEDKKKRLNGRRNFGPFKCLECGKVLSSKVPSTQM